MKILFTRDLTTANGLIKALAKEHTVGVLSIRAEELTSRMDDVQIMSVEERPRLMVELVKYVSSETVPPVYLSGFKDATDSFRPDILVLMECNRFDLFQALRYKHQNPSCRLVLWTETKRLPRRTLTRLGLLYFLWVVRTNLRSFSSILTYTEEGRNFWEKETEGRLPVSVIPSVVNAKEFSPEFERTWMPDGTLRIVMNARFVPYKRHRDMFDALVLLRARGIRFRLTCVGNYSAGREEVALQAKSLGLSEWVTFCDSVPHKQVPEILAMHDVLVLPSYNEALGLVVPEAMASGMPTITSDTVGANVYVKEGETGYIFTTFDAQALAACLERIADPTVLSRMGNIARDHVERHFTADILKSKFVESVSDR